MLKILIILILVGYVFYKVTSFLFAGMFRGFSSQPGNQGQSYTRSGKRAPNSNVNIDNDPRSSRRQNKEFRGGEYVDYEEVK